MRSRGNLWMLAALIAGTVMLALPATASADSRVSTQVPCVAYANGGANFYSGSGTEVITNNGDVVLTCHLTLVYGTPVSEPTTTTYGNGKLLQLHVWTFRDGKLVRVQIYLDTAAAAAAHRVE
jgi:hypothetical protein